MAINAIARLKDVLASTQEQAAEPPTKARGFVKLMETDLSEKLGVRLTVTDKYGDKEGSQNTYALSGPDKDKVFKFLKKNGFVKSKTFIMMNPESWVLLKRGPDMTAVGIAFKGAKSYVLTLSVEYND